MLSEVYFNDKERYISLSSLNVIGGSDDYLFRSLTSGVYVVFLSVPTSLVEDVSKVSTFNLLSKWCGLLLKFEGNFLDS